MTLMKTCRGLKINEILEVMKIKLALSNSEINIMKKREFKNDFNECLGSIELPRVVSNYSTRYGIILI